MRRLAFFLLLGALIPAVFLSSCSKAEQPGASKTKGDEIRKEYREGTFSVRLTVSKNAVSIAESLALTLEAETESGFRAELPDLAEKVGEFSVEERREEPPQLTPKGTVVAKRIYTLEPLLPGDYLIPSLQTRFRKAAPEKAESGAAPNDEAPVECEISTEELTIEVYSLLEKDGKKPALYPIKGVVALPAEPVSPLLLLLGLVVAGLVALGMFYLIKRRKAAAALKAARPLPAHELAFLQLREILDEKLVERGEIKLFFSRISDVLRSYVENRFGLRAPKRTTEELLSDVSRDPAFSVASKKLLIEFLQGSDLVKFAEHQPSQEEIARAIDSCKAFIEITKAPAIDEEQEKEQ